MKQYQQIDALPQMHEVIAREKEDIQESCVKWFLRTPEGRLSEEKGKSQYRTFKNQILRYGGHLFDNMTVERVLRDSVEVKPGHYAPQYHGIIKRTEEDEIGMLVVFIDHPDKQRYWLPVAGQRAFLKQ